MKDKRSLHLKVQELCDCFATEDPLKGMSLLKKEVDSEDAPLKWLALAVLHGVNDNAEKITLTRTDDGEIRVKAQYRTSELPSPGKEIGAKILESVRELAHLEGDQGSLPLALGLRDSSLELKLKVKRKDGRETVTIKFPEK
ncbi:MAG: hypothetical protein SWC40_02195 [Thermodesulfobacteriota bacterium]|nr:hypothetical protein [Thermodesulfobacteriota bacterium]